MSKITATYTPTLTNMRVVRTLENILPIRFQPLDEDIIRRVAQLAQVEGRTIHLWGDGEKHHESYFVTRGKVRFKINIDRHADRTDERYVSFTSHMGASERDGIKVITQVNRTERADNAKVNGLEYGTDEIGVSVDLDGVDEMPVLEKWLFPYGMGLYGWEVVELIGQLGPRIRTLDIGGLIEEGLPDFNLIRPFKQEISIDEMLRFLSIIKRYEVGSEEQQIVDRVMSKTTETIASCIQAFM